jgi:hypothetical protein
VCGFEWSRAYAGATGKVVHGFMALSNMEKAKQRELKGAPHLGTNISGNPFYFDGEKWQRAPQSSFRWRCGALTAAKLLRCFQAQKRRGVDRAFDSKSFV